MKLQFPKIILKPGKDQSLLRFHPWVFSGAILKIDGDVAEGDVVSVYDSHDNFLALGHYQPGTISVRVFSFSEVDPGAAFWRSKVHQAWEYRKSIGIANSAETNMFRIVNGEGDYIPSLIADYYNGTLVMQIHSVGMYRSRNLLIQGFRDILGERLHAIFDKSEATLPFNAEIPKANAFIFGDAEQNAIPLVSENGLRFKVNVIQGQKTGFFIDQRENRKLLKDFSNNRDVLNMFGYTGGFSVYALAGGAKSVHTVDSSKTAIETARENIRINFGEGARHEAFGEDAFIFLKDIKNKYDVIVLDPPAFAKHNVALHNALKGYQRLNAMAIEAIRPGGFIFTFSCSQVVSRLHFRQAVFGAAAQTRRNVRILYNLSQPPDHPVDIGHPEGEYLKGLVLYVE